jgi:hypothetical protein
MRHRASRLVAAIVTLVLTTSIPATAQAQACGPNDVVTSWWPRLTPNSGSETLTAVERKAVLAQLTAIETMMRKTNYSTPRGFAVTPVFRYHEITSRTEIYPYRFDLQTFKLCDRIDEHSHDLALYINPDPMLWSESDRPQRDERGDGLYTELIRTPTLFGATATFGVFHGGAADRAIRVLFTTGGQSPTLPVTREEYVRFRIFTVEGKDGQTAKAAAAFASKTSYDRWLEEAPARKKVYEETLAMIVQVAPAQAAKVRADFEKNEQEQAARLKQADAAERAQVAKNVASVTAWGDKYRARIAAMTPQERTAPAFVLGIPGEPLPVLVLPGTPNARAIVRKNPAFYRTARSPITPKAILVEMPDTHREYWDQQEQLYKGLDWVAIKKMVEP